MRQLALYGLNGVVNTIGGYVVFVLLARFLDYRIAIVVGYGFGMLTSYMLNSSMVFQARGRIWRFAAVNLSLLGLNLALTWTLVEMTKCPAEIVQLGVIPAVFLVGYLLNKAFVFTQPAVRKK